jgi:hypothetical protein
MGHLQRKVKRAGWSGLVLILALLAGAPVAFASGEYEPNDTFDTATGLAGETDYNATFETDNDEDWFVFYLSRPAQVDVSATFLTAPESDGYDFSAPAFMTLIEAN